MDAVADRSNLPEPSVRASPAKPPRQSENDARAGVEGKRGGGGADRREAERLGVLEDTEDTINAHTQQQPQHLSIFILTQADQIHRIVDSTASILREWKPRVRIDDRLIEPSYGDPFCNTSLSWSKEKIKIKAFVLSVVFP
ncbi:unnamed protein product [Camellia sinensis]